VTLPVKNRRGLALVIFDNSFNSGVKFIGYYDLYGSNAARTQLARKLDTVADDEMFVLVSYDAIGTNKDLDKKMTQLNSQAWHKIKRRWRYPYAAIGTGKFGIISEDLKGYDEKQHAYAQVAFESLKPEEGMGIHTALLNTKSQNDNLLVWNGSEWVLSAQTIDGKSLSELRQYILSGVDLSVKYDVTGGVVNGSVVFDDVLYIKKDLLPTGNEIQDLGTASKRFSKIHLSDNHSISMGQDLNFNKNSFVYTVEKETDSVVFVPAGSLIVNRATGEAVVKKSNFVASSTNTTFRTLSQDKKYGATIGGNNFNFKGDKGIWMGSWNHGYIQKVSIPTPGNTSYFGSCKAGGYSAGASDSTRGLSFHQHNTDEIQYITIATPMNAVTFGLFKSGWSSAAASDGTRAVTFGGYRTKSNSYYVFFATPMNSTEFGSINSAFHCAAVSDGSKAIFDRGQQAWSNQQYQYVSLSSPQNSIYFGKMQRSRGWTGAASNGTYGLWAGGWNGGAINDIERLTLKTPANSSHFGNLSYSRHTADPVANDTTMVAAGGNTYSTLLDTVNFANGGSAVKFGNASRGIRYSAYFSGN